MAGLLDIFDDPGAQIGLGLLAAASPRADAAGFGQRLMEGINSAQGMRDAATARQMKDLQFKQLKLRNDLLNNALSGEVGQPQEEQPIQVSPTRTAPTGGGIAGGGMSPDPMQAQVGNLTNAVQQYMARPQAAVASQDWSPQKIRAFAMSGDTGLMKAAEMEQQRQMARQTDFTKLMQSAGIDPNSIVGKQLIQAQIGKQNYIAPVPGRAGGYIIYADGRKEYNPVVPEGMVARQDQTTGQMVFEQDPNIIAGIAAKESAVQQGKNSQTPATAYTTSGTSTFSTVDRNAKLGGAPVVGAPPAGTPNPAANPSVYGNSDVERLTLQRDELIREMQKLPAPTNQATIEQRMIYENDLKQVNAQLARAQQVVQQQPQQSLSPEPPPGTVKGAENLQSELSDKWKRLDAAHQEAQNTVSYLGAIKEQAKRAVVGPMSEKLQFANSLLASVGNERALDAATATDLLNKYSNQIVTRLGQGGLGTDAARSMLQAAYPNSHMTEPAIEEASNNLIGANKMLQWKHQLLMPYSNSRDPTGYNTKEAQFDKVADPSLFQVAYTYKAMKATNPKAAAAFAADAAAKDPTFATRMAELEKMGVKF